MALSYHGVIGHTSKTTLPSVETWGANMNILRDPPKSIQTRKIDKVGGTSEITQMVQESGDRACEAILEYARGVNPMVSVSYDNYGNNGGNRSRGLTKGSPGCHGQGNSGQQAYLPYRIMNGGAFRYPIYDQRDLLPISRLPRVWTSSFTKPGFADFSKRTKCPGTAQQTQQVHSETLKTCVRPRVVYQIQTPIVETYEVRNVIQNPIKVAKYSGLRTIGKVTTHVDTPTKQVIEDPVHYNVHANVGAKRMEQDIDLSHIDTEKYLQDTLHSDVQAHTSHNIQVTPINELFSVDTDTRTKDQMHIDYTANRIGNKQQEYIHRDLELQRTLPEHKAHTNRRQNIYKQVVEPVVERQYNLNRPTPNVMASRGSARHQVIDEITNRQYTLKPTINPGGFEMTTPSVPTIQREQQLMEFDSDKSRMRRRIFEMQHGRHEGGAQNPYAPMVSPN